MTGAVKKEKWKRRRSRRDRGGVPREFWKPRKASKGKPKHQEDEKQAESVERGREARAPDGEAKFATEIYP